MIKRKRDIARLAEREGLVNVAVLETRNCHYRIEGTHHGKTVKIITPYSPGDYRNGLNLRGNIRRAMRSIESAIVKT